MEERRPKILVVDDEEVNVELLEAILSTEYDVIKAYNGGEALEKVNHDAPDLILLDIMMPRLDGYEVCKRLKGRKETNIIPVVMVTALKEKKEKIKGLEVGADDFLTKPVDHAELLARVKSLLRIRHLYNELTKINETLEQRVKEQMAELVRSGELRRFLPQALVESVLCGQIGAAARFERRRVTAMFADMVGFTTLTECLEPEEMASLLNEYLCEMIVAANAHGGTIEKFIGDCVVLIFGAPQASEAEAQVWAALKTAVAMKASAERLATLWRRRGLSGDFSLRIGVNTGYCTVGIFGSDVFKNYAALGTTVNAASRIQTEAPPGAILCGLPAYALVQDRVHAKAYGPLSLRGLSHPVEVYEILDLLDQEAVSNRGAEE